MKLRTLLYPLLLVVAVRLVLAAATPVFDTSEARYAAMSANMARTGDFLVPRFTYKGEYQSFDGKPPLLFQAGGVACKVFGVNEFAVRLPVLLATGFLFVLLFRVMLVLTDGDRHASLLAVTMTATSTAYAALVGFCMTDGLLVACVAGALLAHAALVKSVNRNWSLAVFALLGFGMIVKGPVALVEFGLPVFLDCAVNRRWAVLTRYRWFWGLGLFALIAAPWFVLMARQNPDFLWYFFVNENLLRFLVHEYGDKYGAGRETFRGMALVWLLVVTLPWSLGETWRWLRARLGEWPGERLGERRGRGRTAVRNNAPSAVLGWGVVGITGFWCLTSRVPMAYLMPTVPLACAWLVLRASSEECQRLTRRVPLAAYLTSLVLVVGILGGMFITDKMQGAAAPFKMKRYSYEFYHGVHGIPAGEVAR